MTPQGPAVNHINEPAAAAGVSDVAGGGQSTLASSPDSGEALATSPGRSSLVPFLTSPGCHRLPLLDGRAFAGYRRVGHFGVTLGGMGWPAGDEEPHLVGEAWRECAGLLEGLGLRPVLVGLSDPGPLLAQGWYCEPAADEAVLRLADFTLAGSRRASLRHSVTSAERMGVSVHSYHAEMAPELKAISTAWLAHKNKPELGFTLSRHDDLARQVGKSEGGT